MGSKSAEARSGRLSHRRAVLLYLLAIVGPTLALLFLGLQSVRRQRLAVASLTASNLRLSGERLATELERRVSQLTEACLRDDEVVAIQGSLDTPISPEGTRRAARAPGDRPTRSTRRLRSRRADRRVDAPWGLRRLAGRY